MSSRTWIVESVSVAQTAWSTQSLLFKVSALPSPILIQRSALHLLKLKLKAIKDLKALFHHPAVVAVSHSIKHNTICAPSPTWRASWFPTLSSGLSKSSTSRTSTHARWARFNLSVSYVVFAEGWEIAEIKLLSAEMQNTLRTFCF